MVAYSFQPRFVEAVASGAQTQTIRKHRRPPARRARVGESIALWTGMRTREARLIGHAPCAGLYPISIRFGLGSVAHVRIGAKQLMGEQLDDFARQDGFASAYEMSNWFLQTHGNLNFDGVLVMWSGLVPAEVGGTPPGELAGAA